jgi:hypothetical protein
MCVLIFSTILSEAFLILRRIQPDIINAYWRSCKETVTLVSFQWNLNVFDRFSKNTQITHFMKIRPVGAELLHTDVRADMKKLLVAFRKFAKAPKNDWLVYILTYFYLNTRMDLLPFRRRFQTLYSGKGLARWKI